jgi:hypothetical protein
MLSHVLCAIIQTSLLAAGTVPGDLPNAKAEQVKTKFNSGEFSLSTFALAEN